MKPPQARRPVAVNDEAGRDQAGKRVTPDSTCHHDKIRDTEALARRAVGHAHAVLVFHSEGRYTRRLYLSLHSADKALQRARERGQEAACLLVALVPVVDVRAVLVGGASCCG